MAESEQVDPPHTFDMTDDIPNNAHTELAPMDRGKQANLILLGCSLLQLPVWGTYGTNEDSKTNTLTTLNSISHIIRRVSGELYIAPVRLGG